MKLFWIGLGALLCASISGIAHAQSLTGSSPGFHYFYKAGADMTAHNKDLVACAIATRGLVNGSDAMTGITASSGGGLFPALIGGIIDGNENRQGAAANTENCMAIKGWSVFGLTEEEGRYIEALDNDPAKLRETLSILIESDAPKGRILRGPFANELAIGNFTTGAAQDLEEVSLSVRAVRDLIDAAIDSAGKLKPPKIPSLPSGVRAPKAVKTIKKKDFPAANPELAYVTLRMRSDNRTTLNMTNLTLHRLNDDGAEVIYDGLPVTVSLGGSQSPKVEKTKEGEDRVYDFVAQIPPGHWKVASIKNLAYSVDFCFGAPAFTVKDGEAVFLGEMTLRDSGGYPLAKNNLDIARTILAPAPAIAENLRAVDYVNGYMSDCFGSYAYAYEIPGAPSVTAGEMAILPANAASAQPAEAQSDTLLSNDNTLTEE